MANPKPKERQAPGRRKGSDKTGGRQKGTRNKATTERELLMSNAIGRVLRGLTPKAIDAMTPRDVMHLVMTTGLSIGDLKMAYMAAVELAPYCHPKLSAIAVDATINADPATLTDAQLDARLAQLDAHPAVKRARKVH